MSIHWHCYWTVSVVLLFFLFLSPNVIVYNKFIWKMQKKNILMLWFSMTIFCTVWGEQIYRLFMSNKNWIEWFLLRRKIILWVEGKQKKGKWSVLYRKNIFKFVHESGVKHHQANKQTIKFVTHHLNNIALTYIIQFLVEKWNEK